MVMSSTVDSHSSLVRKSYLLLSLLIVTSVRFIQRVLQIPRRLLVVISTGLLPLVSAQSPSEPGPGRNIPYNGSVPHLTQADTWAGNAQTKFFVSEWINRGVALRYNGDDQLCYNSLIATLGSIINIRLAEYSGVAGVLSLLPAIGALLGAPTNEIWRLWTVIPFGGVLTMLLSFGGAILPIKIEDYERDIRK